MSLLPSTQSGSTQDKRMFVVVFSVLSLFYIGNAIFSAGFNGAADTITHFQIARYSWKYPYLLMDQWGKPIFTLIASPFAHLGFNAVVFFNIALILWGAWLSWRIATRLQLNNAWLVPFFVLFAPIVMGDSVSALTEMICSLFLIGYIHLILKDKFVWASLLVSFMPFARSEGFVVLAVIFLFYAFTRRWKYIPLLVFGSLVYNIIGFIQTGQPLWIFTNNPYVTTAIDVYGSGPIYHFLMLAIPIFGIAFVFVVWATIVKARSFGAMLTGKISDEHEKIWFWIILGTSWGYFAAHTFLWWQGMWASLGLTRVMFVIVIPFSLLAVYGYNQIASSLSKVPKFILDVCVAVLTIVGPFLVDEYPFPLGLEEQEHNKVIAWYAEHPEMDKQKLFAANPYLPFKLAIDPYDKNAYEPLWSCREAKPGDLVLWDAHFGPNEHHVPLAQLASDSSFVLLEKWKPERAFSTLNGYDFELALYQKK